MRIYPFVLVALAASRALAAEAEPSPVPHARLYSQDILGGNYSQLESSPIKLFDAPGNARAKEDGRIGATRSSIDGKSVLPVLLTNGKTVPLTIGGGFVVDRTLETASNGTWVLLSVAGHKFWTLPEAPYKLHTAAAEVNSVNDFSTVCLSWGKCVPATPQFLAEVRKYTDKPIDAATSPYTIVGMETGESGRFYRLQLDESIAKELSLKLPKRLWIPAVSREGKPTASFVPC